MYIDFIFFKKQFQSKSDLNSDVKKFLENKLHYKSGYISYNENKIECVIDNCNIKRAVPVRIKIDDETDKNIEIFNTCKEMIKNHSKKDFYLNISYDGLSRYFSYKLYPDLAEFESKLRSIAYSTLINDLGYDWVKESFPHSDTTKLKLEEIEKKEDNNRHKEYSKLIRNALDEFTLKDLSTYLFTEYQYPNDYMIVEELLNLAKSGEINQEKLEDIESKRVPKSLINRYFENDDFKFIIDNFRLINDARNDVMHHKEISINEYNKYHEALKKSLKIVNSLYNEINSIEYKKVKVGEIASAFGNAYRSMGALNEYIEGLRNLINTELNIAGKVSVNSIGESIKSQIPIPAIETLTVPINEHFSNLAKAAVDYNSIIGEFGNTQRQIVEIAGMSKIQDLIKPAFSENMTQNKIMKVIEDNNKKIMDFNLPLGESFLDDNDIEQYEDSDQSE